MNADKAQKVLLIASANVGKFREIAAELAGLELTLRCLADMPPVPPCEEDGATFMANAEKKARHFAQQYKCMTLADDSGLQVDALGGLPGVISARYAGEPCDDAANNRKLLEELAGVPPHNRTARFKCAMALADPRGNILARTVGVIEGVIIDQLRGEHGFGYDPLFLVPDLGKTTAEIPTEHKNRISHRGKATRAMRAELQRLLPQWNACRCTL